VQQEVGMGSARVRGPRLELSAEEKKEARGIVQQALRTRPIMPAASAAAATR